MSTSAHGPLRVGIGGPVGSGKTALMEALCKAFRNRYDICAITNDIYTKEDARILTVAGALATYFTFAAVQGDHGVFSRVQINADVAALRHDRDALAAQVASMENRTRRLSDQYLDLDLLDEQARDVLGYIRADEIVIR